MAFIGNSVQNQGFTPAIDYFNGNGVTVTFTLSRPIASVAQVIVAVDNVIQNPSSAFGVVGNSITFTSAPLSGTNNIWVEYTSLITTYQGISQDPTVIGDIRATGGYLAEGDFGNSFVDGNLIDYVTGRGRFTVGELDDITFYHGGTSARSEMMDLYHAGGAKIYGTTALTIPVGTTAQRPGTPATGMTRYNTTLGTLEFYNGTSWFAITATNTAPYSVDYLIVAAGSSGGTGTYAGGGGGGGEVLSSSAYSVSVGTAYTVTIGAGGSGGTFSVGNDSVFGSFTSRGGGTNVSVTNDNNGAGSGNGNARGAGSGGSPSTERGGGGGGAGGVGASGASTANGGAGVSSSYSGSSVGYGGGGGGGQGTGYGSGTALGQDGGGNGSFGGSGAAISGTANRGGGGGGGASVNISASGNGGSGLVIVRYLGTQRGTGGTVTSSGGYTIHTFTSSGTFTA